MKMLYSTFCVCGLNFAVSTEPTVRFSNITGLPALSILALCPTSFRRRPCCPIAEIGGSSDTVNVLASSWLLPGANEMYEPESSVFRPVTPFWSMRGFTTQNCVSSRIISRADGCSLATTSTPLWSGRRRMLLTRPISTFKRRMVVVLTSMPSALSISKVISGPCWRE